MERIGLIAGEDKFPILFAKAAKANNCQVIAIAINGHTDSELCQYADKIYWVNMGQIGKVFQILLLERLKKVVLAGKIPKIAIFKKEPEIDEESASILESSHDKRTSTLLKEVANRLKKIGITLMDSTTYLKDSLVKEGVMTRAEPDKFIMEQIKLGYAVARDIAKFDIGQTVVVKDKDIVAVEGVEGTNETIKRAGDLVGPDIIVVKVARPNQDMRFDVPTIGVDTIKTLIKVQAKALAIEALKTLVIDKDDVVRLADENNISIIAI